MRYILEQNAKVLTVGQSIFEVTDEINPPILNLNGENIAGKANGDPLSIWYSNGMEGISAQQAVAANQPVYRPNAINGYPAVEFDLSKCLVLQTGAVCKTLFIVCRYLDAAPGYVGMLTDQGQTVFRMDHFSTGNFFFGALQGFGAADSRSWNFKKVRLYVGGVEVAPPGGFVPKNFFTVVAIDIPVDCTLLQLGQTGNLLRFQIAHLSGYDYRMKYSDRVKITNQLRQKYQL